MAVHSQRLLLTIDFLLCARHRHVTDEMDFACYSNGGISKPLQHLGPAGDKKSESDSRAAAAAVLAAAVAGGKLIQALPFDLTTKTAVFQEKYMEHIGYTVHAADPNGILRLGVNTVDVLNAIEGLGFQKLREDMAEYLVPDDEKLTLLLAVSCDNPALSGTGYLKLIRFATLCNTWQLLQSLRQIEDSMFSVSRSFLTGSGSAFGQEYFLPFTLSMGDDNLESILKLRPGIYLVKSGRDQPKRLLRIRANHVPADLLAFLRSSSELQNSELSQLVLQTYIDRPLLVDKRKFDLRVHLLVANPKRSRSCEVGGSFQAGYFAFFHPGLVRLGSSPFDPENPCPSQQGVPQLLLQPTGDSVNSQQLQEVNTWYPDELNLYLNRKRRAPQPDWVRNILYPRIGAVLGYLAAVFRCRLDDRDVSTNTFRIISFHILVDDQLRLHLLDFEANPSWCRQTSVQSSVNSAVWLEAICLVSEVAIRFKTYRTISDDRLVTRQNFRLVYSSEDPYLARRNVTLMYD